MTDDKKGFAKMKDEEVRDIASEGGKAAHEPGTANEFKAGSDEAREAGQKGGEASSSQNKNDDMEAMSDIEDVKLDEIE